MNTKLKINLLKMTCNTNSYNHFSLKCRYNKSYSYLLSLNKMEKEKVDLLQKRSSDVPHFVMQLLWVISSPSNVGVTAVYFQVMIP